MIQGTKKFIYLCSAKEIEHTIMKKILKAAALSAMGVIMLNSCIFINYPNERGNRVTASGTDTTLVFENIAATYDEINISNNMIVRYSESADCITITADKNIAPYIKVFVEEGELNIDEKGVMLINVPAAEVLVPVSSKPLKSIDVSGASRFSSDIVLENKAVRDENSYKVIQMMHEHKVFDFGFNFDATGSAYGMLGNVVISGKSTDFASHYQKNEKKILNGFEKIVNACKERENQ